MAYRNKKNALPANSHLLYILIICKAVNGLGFDLHESYSVNLCKSSHRWSANCYFIYLNAYVEKKGNFIITRNNYET